MPKLQKCWGNYIKNPGDKIKKAQNGFREVHSAQEHIFTQQKRFLTAYRENKLGLLQFVIQKENKLSGYFWAN